MSAAPVIPSSPTPPTEAAPLSEGARIVNTFIAPSKTFTDLRRNASWWAPWILMAAFSLLFAYTVDRQVTFDQISRNEINRSAKISEQFDKAPPAQQEQQLRISDAIIRYSFYGGSLLILLFNAIIAGILFATFKVAGAVDLKFKTAYATVMYAGLPGILTAILGTISLFSGANPEGFNVNYPVGTNPAYYMDPSTSKFVLGLASIPDVISIWTIVLLGIGFAVTSKMKKSTAITIVAAWYLLWKLGTAALAGARG
jgi:hypothetical protein